MPGPGYKRKELPGPSTTTGRKVRRRRQRHLNRRNRRTYLRVRRRTIRREDRQAAREAAQMPTQYLTERKEGNETAYRPTEGDAYGRILEDDIRAADPEAINEGLAKASEVARPIAEAMTWIGGPEVKGGTTLLKTIGKIVTRRGATKAGEKAAGRAAVKEGEKVAVRTAGKAAAKAEAKREATRSARRAAKKGQKAVDEAIKKASKKRVRSTVKQGKGTLRSRAGGAVKRQAKKRRPAITSGRDAMKGALYRKGTQTTIAGGVAAGTVAGPAAGVLESTGRALEESPGETLKTTAQAIPGFVTAPVKLGIEAYESGKNVVEGNPDPLAPLEGEWEAQKQYWAQWAKAAGGGEKGEKVIREKLGLIPVLTGALGLQAATRPFRIPKAPREPRVVRVGARPRRVRKLREEAGSTDRRTAERAQGGLLKAERVRSRRTRRKDAAREHDLARRRAEGSFRRDMLEGGEAGGKRRTFNESMRRLGNVPIDEGGATLADAVQLVHREGIPLDATAGRAALIEVRESLTDPNGEIAPSARGTRQVLDALIENPELLEHSDLLRVEQQLRAIRADQAAAEFPPDRSDRARHVAQARTHGVDTPEERVPFELRDKVKTKPKKYEKATPRLRAEVRRLIGRAKKKEAQAKVLPKDSAKRQKLEAEAEALRAQAQEIRDVVRRPQQARRLEAQAYNADPVEAANLKAAAQAIRREHQASQDALTREFHDEMAGVRQEKGLREPIFFHDLDARDAGEPTRGGQPVSAAGAAPKDKMKLGQLSEMGLVDEAGDSLIESIYRDRANAEMNASLRRILDSEAEARWVTGPQLRREMREGRAPAGHSAVPLQDIKRAYARGDWEHALGLIKSASRDALSEADFTGKGKKYAWIPTSTLQEVYRQADQTAGWAKNLRRFGGAQSFLLLGTSPTWAAFQGFATPLVLMARHPNPLTWAKATRAAVKAWRENTPRERAAFNSIVGSNFGDVYQFRNEDFGPTSSNIRRMSDASRVMKKTWAGRLLHNLTRGGGPLIRGVAAYENALRTLEGLMEADKLYNRGPLTRWTHSLAGLDAATRKQIDKVSKMSPAERIRYLGDPRNTKELERRVMSTLGDWSSLTAREKTWSGALIFYPFLRFSLRWMFHTFPRDNPIKAAILLNFAQQNAQEVERMLGTEPSFFQSFGQVPFRNSEGEVEGAVNLARAAPGSNALIEALGSGESLNLSMAGRLIQPALAAVLLQGVGGLDPFTGEKEGSNAQENALLAFRQIVGLSPVGRAFAVPALEEASEFLQPSPTSEFFRTLDGRTPIEKAFVPDFTTTESIERAKAQSGDLLDTMSEAPTPEEIGEMADHIAANYPGLNESQLRERPEIKEFIQRARKADKASDVWGRVLEEAGLGDSEEVNRNFGNIFNLVDPIGGFGQPPIERRTEAQRVRFLRDKGVTNEEIDRDYPRLAPSYDLAIERLRRSGMTDEEIAAKYPNLRRHLREPSSSGWGGSSWGSGSGWGSGSSWGSSGW